MSEEVQTTVQGDQLDQEYGFTTTGRVIRPFKQLVTQILQGRSDSVDIRVDLDSDGLHVDMVDASNVILVQTTIPASTFTSFSVDGELEVGVSNQILGTLFQHARYGKSTDDTVSVTGNDAFMETTVTRDLHGVETTFTERQGLIDPKSIRSHPDLPDLDMTAEFGMPPQAFVDIINAIDPDYAKMEASESVHFHAETDVGKTSIDVAADVEGDGAKATYSMGYLERIAKALHVGKVDTTEFAFADEHPLFVEFEREDVYSGTIMLAPRVEAGDEP